MATNGTTNGSHKAPVVCVFCGAREGKNPVYMEAARALGNAIAAAGATLVYGGGTVGLMGEVARTVVAASPLKENAAHGIIPGPLVKYEQSGPEKLPDKSIFGKTTVVTDMHTRKQMFLEQVRGGGPGSGFIALPGGFGTSEELLEITTWNQLGIHEVPIILLNTNGFWDGLVACRDHAVAEGFVGEDCKNIIYTAKTPQEALEAVRSYKPAEGRFDLTWDAVSPTEG